MRFRTWALRYRSAVIALLLLGAGPVTAAQITIVEFYNTTLRHYVLITDPAEAAAIEAGAAGPGWERTGGTLLAYSAGTDAPNLVPVCRFYGSVSPGPNSHFFTADAAECAQVKLDPGWHFEGIAFYVSLRPNAQCAVGQQPVWRAYNNGFRPPPGFNDGNHRFSTDHATILALVPLGWTDEGIVFCVPGGTAPGTTAADCAIPVPGFSGNYHNSASPNATIRYATTGTALAPVETSTITSEGVTIQATNRLLVTPTQSGGKRLSWDRTRIETTGPGLRIVQDLSNPQALDLPMQPGSAQTTGGPVSGSHTIEAPPYSCSGTMSGTQQATYTFIGVESVTVPAGTFIACKFNFNRSINLQSTCGQGFGAGASTDSNTLWFFEGFIVKNAEGSGGVTELVSYTR